ncbi:MAG: hypothetical protein ACLS6G_03535 [Christensenellales bacterium]
MKPLCGYAGLDRAQGEDAAVGCAGGGKPHFALSDGYIMTPFRRVGWCAA